MKISKIKLLLFFAMHTLFFSCKDQENQFAPAGAINIVNTVIGGGNLKMEHNETDSVVVNGFKRFLIEPGLKNLKLYPTNNSSISYFKQQVDIKAGVWYSLYLTGIASGDVEAVFLKENFKENADSVISLRLINLSPNVEPINVTLTTSPTLNEFTNVAYKSVSEFKSFPALRNANINMFQFQFRSASTNAVLATYNLTASNLSLTRFRSATLVLKGLQGGIGSQALSVIFVPSY